MAVTILFFLSILILLVISITYGVKSMFLKLLLLGMLLAFTLFIVDYNLRHPVLKLKIEFKNELSHKKAYYDVKRIMEFLKTPKKRSIKFVPGNRFDRNSHNHYEYVYTPHYWEHKKKTIIIYLSQSPKPSIEHDFISNFSTRFLEKHEHIEVARDELLKHIANKFETSMKKGNKKAKYKLEEVYDLLDELENKSLYFKDDPKFNKFIVQKTFLLNFYGEPTNMSFSSETFVPFYNFNARKY